MLQFDAGQYRPHDRAGSHPNGAATAPPSSVDMIVRRRNGWPYDPPTGSCTCNGGRSHGLWLLHARRGANKGYLQLQWTGCPRRNDQPSFAEANHSFKGRSRLARSWAQMHRGRNLLRKPVLIQCDVNRWTSTALRCAESNALLTRPGRSLPCSWVSGLSSSNTLSVLRLGNFSSPSLRRTRPCDRLRQTRMPRAGS